MRKVSLLIILVLIGCISAPAFVNAEITDYLRKLNPYTSIGEYYTDNFYYSPTNKQHDFVTTVSAGIGFSPKSLMSDYGWRRTSPPSFLSMDSISMGNALSGIDPSGIDLSYRFGLNYYANHENLNYISHNGALNAWHIPDRGIYVGLREYFIRSNEPWEPSYPAGAPPGEYVLGTTQNRVIYNRNVVEPSIGYRFGREDFINFSYLNNYYKPEGSNAPESQNNSFISSLNYWFTIQNGVFIRYTYNNADFQTSPDFQGQSIQGRYTFRVDQRMSLFADYIYITRNYESPGIDYNVQNPTIGITGALSPTLRGTAQAGYYWYQPQTGGANSGPSINLNLIQTSERMSYTLFFIGGFTGDYFSYTNYGASQRYYGGGSATYQIDSRSTIGALGSIGHNNYMQAERKEWVWRLQGSYSYQVFQWLLISLSAYHAETKVNIQNSDVTENRLSLLLNLYM